MNDLEITRLCAEAMGIDELAVYRFPPVDMEDTFRAAVGVPRYDPLHNDAQAMALVKKFHLHIGKTLRTPDDPFGKWFVSKTDKFEVSNHDLNRAICECVAKMQQAKALCK